MTKNLKLASVAAVLTGAAFAVVPVVHSEDDPPVIKRPHPAVVTDAGSAFRALSGTPALRPSDPAAQRIQTNARGGGEDASMKIHATRRGKMRVHVGVGPRVVCLEVVNEENAGSLGCTETTSATDPHTPLMSVDSIGEAGAFQVTGLMASSAGDTVAITDVNGAVTEGKVVDNVFTVALKTRPERIRWTTPDGPDSQRISG